MTDESAHHISAEGLAAVEAELHAGLRPRADLADPRQAAAVFRTEVSASVWFSQATEPYRR